ncbi:sugar ABC transporter permease [Thermoactinospora rubra]|uniref:sugar ABC transporter permease n=1 Tax=Thermoactinospora rubra TaxID=1088767 RepID=UPI00117C3950|nr:sugar ABC transporter permease [Thermoactinospora rubra]
MQRVAGWLLTLPALLAAIVTLVVPTVRTIAMSFTDEAVLRPARPVGAENYTRLLGDERFWAAAGFTLALAILPLLVVVVVAPLLAAALDHGGPWPRRAGRVALSLWIVVCSPVAIAVAGVPLVTPGGGPLVTALYITAALFGAVCGLALIAYLPASRSVGGMLVAGAVLALATLATGLQAFGVVYPLAGRVPTLGVLHLRQAFSGFRLGYGAALATVTGLILGVLGLVAVVVLVAARTRLMLLPRPAEARGSRVPGVVALVLVVVLAILGSLPWLSAAFLGGAAPLDPLRPDPAPLDTVRLHLYTWLPALAGALVSVGVAYLAALGIGGLRPLGRHSEWLLLAFAPWLFVGVGPLSGALWLTYRELGLLDTLVALVDPLLVSVPALVVLTLLCRGLAERGGPFLATVVLPSLPMAAVLVGAVTLLNAQEPLWRLLVATRPEHWSAPVALLQLHSRGFGADPPVGLTTPPLTVAVAFAALVAAQLTYLDRLRLTVGR